MSDAPELLPCPFCGSNDLKGGGDDKVVAYCCLDCHSMGPNHYGSHEWNSRADLHAEVTAERDRLAAENERLQEQVAAHRSRHPNPADYRYWEGRYRDERAENERLRFALKPSGETKAAYMGEFSMEFPEYDEDGQDYMRTINIPWTSIKEIMAAICARATPPELDTGDMQAEVFNGGQE